jgi:hypothetical protein
MHRNISIIAFASSTTAGQSWAISQSPNRTSNGLEHIDCSSKFVGVLGWNCEPGEADACVF